MKVLQSQAKPRNIAAKEERKANYKHVYCVVTGFDAFGIHAFNPSEAIVKTLPKQVKLRKPNCHLDLHGIILPTCGDAAGRIMRQVLDTIPKDSAVCVVLTGLAENRASITIERFALNVRDYRIPDNCGEQWQGDRIDEQGPEAIRTQADIEALVKRLRRKGLPADVSNHAGTFVCNETYYRVLSACQSAKLPHKVLFVHIPALAKFGAKLKEEGNVRFADRCSKRDEQVAILRAAVLDLVAASAEDMIAAQARLSLRA